MLEQDPQLTTTPFDKTSIENKYHCSIDVERAEEVLGAAIQVYLDKGEFFERKKRRYLPVYWIHWCVLCHFQPEQLAS